MEFDVLRCADDARSSIDLISFVPEGLKALLEEYSVETTWPNSPMTDSHLGKPRAVHQLNNQLSLGLLKEVYDAEERERLARVRLANLVFLVFGFDQELPPKGKSRLLDRLLNYHLQLADPLWVDSVKQEQNLCSDFIQSLHALQHTLVLGYQAQVAVSKCAAEIGLGPVGWLPNLEEYSDQQFKQIALAYELERVLYSHLAVLAQLGHQFGYAMTRYSLNEFQTDRPVPVLAHQKAQEISGLKGDFVSEIYGGFYVVAYLSTDDGVFCMKAEEPEFSIDTFLVEVLAIGEEQSYEELAANDPIGDLLGDVQPMQPESLESLVNHHGSRLFAKSVTRKSGPASVEDDLATLLVQYSRYPRPWSREMDDAFIRDLRIVIHSHEDELNGEV